MSEAAPLVDDGQRDLLDHVVHLVAELEAHPDSRVRDAVGELLEGIDAVHRSALTHLVQAVQGMAGDAFLNRLTSDPAIRLLLMAYDLLAVDRRLIAEEALDAARGHLHARGIDVELVAVVGGEVTVRLHGLEESGAALQAVRDDLSRALTAGLIGFQELTVRDRDSVREASPLIPLAGVRRPNRPVYREAMPAGDLATGEMRAVEIDGASILLANVDGEIFAVRNCCGETPLPLQFGTLEGAELLCSWHGCRYDVRTGHRVDVSPGRNIGVGTRLSVFPVAVRNDRILVALGVEPVVTAAEPAR